MRYETYFITQSEERLKIVMNRNEYYMSSYKSSIFFPIPSTHKFVAFVMFLGKMNKILLSHNFPIIENHKLIVLTNFTGTGNASC